MTGRAELTVFSSLPGGDSVCDPKRMPDISDSDVPPSQTGELSPVQLLGRVLGFGLCLTAWIAVAGFSAYIGGSLAGLQPGGWNFQFLPLLPIAFIGGPLVGVVATGIRVSQGRAYWQSLGEAFMAVAGTGFFAGALYFGLRAS